MWAGVVLAILMTLLFISIGYLLLADRIETYFIPVKAGKRARTVWGTWHD